MSEVTRYGRVQRSVESLRSGGRTVVASLRLVRPASAEEEFRGAHRLMASAVREERRRGLFVFAHHVAHGAVGRLWLSASRAPRAGTLGRHDAVDLALPLDEALSLRHALFIVRLVDGRVRTTVVDLASTSGLEVGVGEGAGTPLRRFDAEGAVAVRLSDFVLFLVPTGEPLPWDADGDDPWATFRAGWRGLLGPGPGDDASRDAPPAGRLDAWLGRLRGHRTVTEAELARGLLIGRDGRCDVVLSENAVSRVHAVVLRVDGLLFIVDAGSKNGLWRADDRLVRCAPWAPDEPVRLGHDGRLEWHPAGFATPARARA